MRIWATRAGVGKVPALPCVVLAAALLGAAACSAADTQVTPASYYEFGTVVAEGPHSVDLQTVDPERKRVVQHVFFMTRDSRLDAVHVGDSVEVIYTAAAGGERTLRRLIVLPAGVPVAGPSPDSVLQASSPAASKPTAGSAASASGTVPPVRSANLPQASTRPSTAKAGTPVSLAGVAKPAVPKVASVALGAPASALGPAPPSARNITQSRPAEECNRSSATWPTDPVRIAVIDFRYPTEREEAHDVGTTGGGSGTAVADLVFSRMDALQQTDPRFAFSRGDRRRLDRSDFAGAARLGRQLGVDAVLAGTFFPVTTPAVNTSDAYAPPVITYELRAGLVDSCTGQLLLRLSSVACPQALSPGLDPGVTGAGIEPCKRFAVPAQDATDPRKYAAAFTPLLNAMLYPIEHNGTPMKEGKPEAGSAGLVTAVLATPNAGPKLTLRLPPGLHLKAGEQLGIHAWRLAKNPNTYTLHNLQDEEIGRVTLTRVEGANAEGTYTGDYPPLLGDPAELLQ